MHSNLLYLSNLTLTPHSHPNSVCFNINDQRAVLTVQSIDTNRCFMSLRSYNSYFYTDATSSESLCKLYTGIPSESKSVCSLQPCINEMLSKTSVAIEFNEFSSPVALRLYSLSQPTHLLLVLTLKWMSPDDVIQLQYSSNNTITTLKSQLEHCQSQLASLPNATVVTKLKSQCESLTNRLNTQQLQLAKLEHSSDTCASNHLLNATTISTLTAEHADLQQSVSDVLYKTTLNNSTVDDLQSQAENVLCSLALQSASLGNTVKQVAELLTTLDNTKTTYLRTTSLTICTSNKS